MLKKYGLVLLVAVIIIQLCVPAGMIISSFAVSSQAEKYGTEYKIPLGYISLDEKNNGFLYYDVYSCGYGFEPYLSVSEGKDGLAVLTPVEDEPEGSSYIKKKRNSGYSYIFPTDRIHVGRLKHTDELWLRYLPDLIDDLGEDDKWVYDGDIVYYSEAYLLAYVYNGKLSVKDVYIDGLPAKQFLAQINAQEEATQASPAAQE